MILCEDYVSFETAKLLKEKGFDEPCVYVYRHDGSEDIWDIDKEDIACQKPTLQMAMKWLREVHKLHIEILPNPLDFKHEDIQDGWGCEVTHLSNLAYDGNYQFFQKKYKTYEQACEEAIKYCLEHLI